MTKFSDLSLSDAINVYDVIVDTEVRNGTDLANAIGETAAKLLALYPTCAPKVNATKAAILSRPEMVRYGTLPDTITGTDARLKEIVDAVLKPIPTAPELDARLVPAVDQILKTASNDRYCSIIDLVCKAKGADAKDQAIPDLQAELAKANDALASRPSMMAMPATVAATATTPEGKPTTKKARAVFVGPKGEKEDALNFDVPAMEWDGPHPLVPAIDPNYVFQPIPLLKTLVALSAGDPILLTGPTGSGKTTMVEQLAARLCFPFRRVNLDSEITRLDLIGRDVLARDADGNTVSRFVDGILPEALANPGFLCKDEIDFVRPDVGYVLQRSLERKGLLIAEDGGRLVQQHPMCFLFGTANTKLAGDELGVYQGARTQSLAMRNRFTAWIEIDYLPPELEKLLVKNAAPAIKDETVDKLMTFTAKVREAFRKGEILETVSPRDLQAYARHFVRLSAVLKKNSKLAMQSAFEMVFLTRASAQDAQKLREFADRVLV